MKLIKEYTEYFNANEIQKVYLTKSYQISCVCKTDDGLTWRGEIQKIYLDKEGEAIGYDVYIY